MSCVELVKKYVETSIITDEEILNLQKSYKNEATLFRDVINALIENYVFPLKYFQTGRTIWKEEEYVLNLMKHKVNFKDWFYDFLDYPVIDGVTKQLTQFRYGMDEENRKTVNGFVILDTIGSGSYGKVRLCIHNRTQEKYAVKIMNKNTLKKKKFKDGTTAYDDVKNEINALSNFNHKNIIKLHLVIEPEADDSDIYLIMEYCNGVLFSGKNNQTMDEDVAKNYFKQLIDADIKPDNILIGQNGELKLCDFGSSNKFKLDYFKTLKGTPAFTSPEASSGKEYKGMLLDIWSCGVTLYFFVFGQLPFKGETFIEIFENIKKNQLEFSSRSDLSQHLLDLLTKMLEKDPKKRILIIDIYKHKWFKEKKKYKRIERNRRKSYRLSVNIEKKNQRWSISFLKETTPISESAKEVPKSPLVDTDERDRRQKISKLTHLSKK